MNPNKKPKQPIGKPKRRRRTKAKHRAIFTVIKVSVFLSKRVKKKGRCEHISSRALDNAICFSLRNNWKYDLKTVKLLVETQVKCKVTSIEFDPLSTRSSSKKHLDRWIVGLPSKAYCDTAIVQGLAADGCRVVVRYWNDIVREECGIKRPL